MCIGAGHRHRAAAKAALLCLGSTGHEGITTAGGDFDAETSSASRPVQPGQVAPTVRLGNRWFPSQLSYFTVDDNTGARPTLRSGKPGLPRQRRSITTCRALPGLTFDPFNQLHDFAPFGLVTFGLVN
jgi:hypothetical protein